MQIDLLDQAPTQLTIPDLSTMPLAEKQTRLLDQLRALGSALVAYSGGIDSALVLALAVQTLGRDRVLAVTAVSPSYPSWELDACQRFAASVGARHQIIATREIENPDYVRNGADRCYFCKSELYDLLTPLAQEQGLAAVLNGLNWDDLGDHRPGARAGLEYGIRSPLKDAGLTKADIRAWAQALQLDIWDKPALACLSSRIPYGVPVTVETLRQIDAAERAVRALGLRQVRVRHHGVLARIEVAPEEMAAAFDQRQALDAAVRAAGYLYAALDLRGYRSGSQNDVLRPAAGRRNGAG